MSVAITAPTGNIGRRLVPKLLAAGLDLTLITRSPHKIPENIRTRVNIEEGVLQDSGFIARATRGAEALYWLNPGNKTATDVLAWYKGYGESVANAVNTNEIPHVVNISAIDPNIESAGVASGIGLVEKYLNETSASVAQIRPGYFLENLIPQLNQIRTEGTITFPVPPGRKVDFIATEDIAEVAASYLINRNWSGKLVHYLFGAADVTFPDAAAILSEATGKAIRYNYITLEQFRSDLLKHGVSEQAAEGYTELYARYHQTDSTDIQRSPETTTPTTIAQWGKDVLKPLLKPVAVG
jgi:uncharacterized protein YbjT (DUF2867 family)